MNKGHLMFEYPQNFRYLPWDNAEWRLASGCENPRNAQGFLIYYELVQGELEIGQSWVLQFNGVGNFYTQIVDKSLYPDVRMHLRTEDGRLFENITLLELLSGPNRSIHDFEVLIGTCDLPVGDILIPV